MREVAVKKAEKDAPPGRASGGEKLAEWEIIKPRGSRRPDPRDRGLKGRCQTGTAGETQLKQLMKYG